MWSFAICLDKKNEINNRHNDFCLYCDENYGTKIEMRECSRVNCKVFFYVYLLMGFVLHNVVRI